PRRGRLPRPYRPRGARRGRLRLRPGDVRARARAHHGRACPGGEGPPQPPRRGGCPDARDSPATAGELTARAWPDRRTASTGSGPPSAILAGRHLLSSGSCDADHATARRAAAPDGQSPERPDAARVDQVSEELVRPQPTTPRARRAHAPGQVPRV